MQRSKSNGWRIGAIVLVFVLVLAGCSGLANPAAASAALLQSSTSDIEITFDPLVNEPDRIDVVEGARLGLEVIGSFVGTAGLDAVDIFVSAEEASSGPYTMASTRGNEIEVFTGGRSWQSAPPLIRLETMVHELMHVYQNALEGRAIVTVPLWFDEGTAEALGYLAITRLGVVDQDDVYELSLFQLTHSPVETSLAAFAPYGSMTADSYPLAYIAVQYLLGRAGLSVSALAQVYENIARGMSFSGAFRMVFGQSLDDFYVEFDRWRTSLAAVRLPPPDFIPWRATGQAAPAVWGSIRTEVGAGHQLALVVVTEPGAECVLDLAIPGDPIERHAVASGDGEAFWLVTVPDRTPPGPIGAGASCGAAFIWLDVLVT